MQWQLPEQVLDSSVALRIGICELLHVPKLIEVTKGHFVAEHDAAEEESAMMPQARVA
jgi:hypothetical protein